MKLLLYGVSHQTVPEEDAKKYELSKEQLKEKTLEVSQFPGVEEVLILSNSNRTEFYFHVDETIFRHGDILRFISAYSGEDLERVIMETYSKFNGEVIRHLLKLLSDREFDQEKEWIRLSEVDQALAEAIKWNTAGEVLSTIFEHALVFSFKMRGISKLESFYNSDFSRIIKKLTEEWRSLEHKKVYLAGDSKTMIFMAKALFYLGVSSVIIGTENSKSQKMADYLNQWAETLFSVQNYKAFRSVTSESRPYQLSSADVILSEEDMNEGEISVEDFEKMLSLRLTKKKQLLISFFQKQPTFAVRLKDKGLKPYTLTDLSSGDKAASLNEEEKETVRQIFDDSLETEIESLLGAYKAKVNSLVSVSRFQKEICVASLEPIE